MRRGWRGPNARRTAASLVLPPPPSSSCPIRIDWAGYASGTVEQRLGLRRDQPSTSHCSVPHAINSLIQEAGAGSASRASEEVPGALGAATSCPPRSEGAGRRRAPVMGARAVLQPYLHECDECMEQKKQEFDQGKVRRQTKEWLNTTFDKTYYRKRIEALQGDPTQPNRIQR